MTPPVVTVRGVTTETATTVTVVVAPELGSVTMSVPGALPAEMVSVAWVTSVTDCALMLAPVPPVSVNVGVPGVPTVQLVPVPVTMIELPVVFCVMLAGEAAMEMAPAVKLVDDGSVQPWPSVKVSVFKPVDAGL